MDKKMMAPQDSCALLEFLVLGKLTTWLFIIVGWKLLTKSMARNPVY